MSATDTNLTVTGVTVTIENENKDLKVLNVKCDKNEGVWASENPLDNWDLFTDEVPPNDSETW
jgi:hypothetical protein